MAKRKENIKKEPFFSPLWRRFVSRYPRPNVCLCAWKSRGENLKGGLAERQEKHREMESGSFGTVSNDGECLCYLKKRREFKTQETISRERKEKR